MKYLVVNNIRIIKLSRLQNQRLEITHSRFSDLLIESCIIVDLEKKGDERRYVRVVNPKKIIEKLKNLIIQK